MRGKLGELARRIQMLFRRETFHRDLDEEMRLHLELREQEQREAGLSPEAAHTAAQKNFGNTLALREASHESWGWAWLEHFMQDLRYAFRMFAKNPGFTAVAVLTLALGIGANTVIFSIVDAIFLRPLPFPNASRVYFVGRTGNMFGGMSISPAIFAAWRQRQEGIFEHLTLVQGRDDATWTGWGEPLRLDSVGISTDFLPMLGIHPALGRDFRTEEGRVGGPHVVMLSDGPWRTRFAAKQVIGQSVTLDNEPYTIIGVLPAGFRLPGWGDTELWFPVQVPVTSHDPGNGGWVCLGMLKPGVSVARAEAALTPSLRDLRKEFPKMFAPNERAHLESLHDNVVAGAGTAPLLLFGAVGFVLLIACVNVANLTLARSATRQREMAVRTAIGASRSRIVRQLLTESVLLAVIGGALGVLACYASFGVILSLVPANLPHIGAIAINGQVLSFAFLLSIVTGILFGFAPALGASRVDLSGSLKEASAQSGASHSGRVRSVLASGEVAISLVLLISAALALESLGRLTSVKPGFDASNVLTFHVDLTRNKYPTPASRSAFFDQALSRIAALPGVEHAAIVNTLPLREGADVLFSIEGNAAQANQENDAYFRAITPDYFSALHIPLEAGRAFAASDNASNAPVVVINHAMADAFFHGQNSIGRSIWIGKPMGPANSEPAPRQIIGIVGDIHESTLAERPGPMMFIPYAQAYGADSGFFIVRTRRAPTLTLPDARSVFHTIDANIPLVRPETMESVIADSLTDWRFHAVLLGLFGALALLIAAIGVYGVISYSISQRTHEIGVRMALGAQRDDVLRLVVGQGMRMAILGTVAGVIGAFALTRLMASLLYGVSATDPFTFAGVAVLLMLVALLACYIPARRAMRVDPMVALRYE